MFHYKLGNVVLQLVVRCQFYDGLVIFPWNYYPEFGTTCSENTALPSSKEILYKFLLVAGDQPPPPPPPERIRRQFHLSMTFKTSTKNLVQVLGRWYSTIPQRVYPLKIHLPVTFKISTHWPIPVWILSPWWLIELNKLSLHVKH